jgi:hypothetical protein
MTAGRKAVISCFQRFPKHLRRALTYINAPSSRYQDSTRWYQALPTYVCTALVEGVCMDNFYMELHLLDLFM